MGCGPSKMAASAVELQKGDEDRSGSSDVVSEVKKAFASDNDFTKSIVRMEAPSDTPIEAVYDIDYNEEPLGRGAGGIVRRAKHRATNEYFAVKCLEKSRVNNTQNGLEQLRNEISIMCELDHPNIVRIEEVYESPTMLYIVQELCTGGELFDRLDDEYLFPEEECAKLVKQMLAAVCYLHKHGIIHRDLKLENFLFRTPHKSSELAMIDFGLSKHFETGQHHHEAVGTPYTVAPEIVHGDYDEKIDVWAIGVITYLILSGEAPFGGIEGEDLMEVRKRILQARPDFEPRDVWTEVSGSAKCFVSRLLDPDPEQRPIAKLALQDPWLRDFADIGLTQERQLRPPTVEALLAFEGLTELEKFQSELLSFTLFPEQVVDLRKEFNKIDREGDGEVSLVALKDAVIGNIGSGAVEAAFESIKLRKSALTVRWHEFLAAMIPLAHVDDRNMRLAFDRLDREGKGYLSVDDMSCLSCMLGGSNLDHCDFQRLRSWGNKADRITFSEFKSISCCCGMKAQTGQQRCLDACHHG